jgi:hypothetical protein
MIRYWLEMALLLHLIFCISTVYDLLVESKRNNKLGWTMLIILLPAAGFYLYEMTRKKQLHG